MDRVHRTTIRLDEHFHRRVKAKAALEGRSITDVIRLLLEKWEHNEIELDEVELSSGEEDHSQ